MLFTQEEITTYLSVRDRLQERFAYVSNRYRRRTVDCMDEREILDYSVVTTSIDAMQNHNLIKKYDKFFPDSNYHIRNMIVQIKDITFRDIGRFFHNLETQGEKKYVSYIVQDCLSAFGRSLEKKKEVVSGLKTSTFSRPLEDHYVRIMIRAVEIIIRVVSCYLGKDFDYPNITHRELKFPFKKIGGDYSLTINRNGNVRIYLSPVIKNFVDELLEQCVDNYWVSIFNTGRDSDRKRRR